MRWAPVDPAASDAALAPYCAVVAEAMAAASPAGLRAPAAYVLNRLRNNSPDKVLAAVVAYDGDVLAGAAEVSWVEAPDNRDRAWVTFEVPDRLCSDAVADALLAAVAAVAVPAGRTLLMVEVEAGSALSGWLARRGARYGSVSELNVLRLAGVSRAEVAALAGGVPDGYEVLWFAGGVPDELLPSFTRLQDAMNDAPHDDLTVEDAVTSPERVRRWEAGVAARGWAQWTAVAREVASGELAAFNQLILRTEWPQVVENSDTGVAALHRGRGLGLVVKAANLLRVLDGLPDAVCVETWNAASNDHMIRVNRRLGFVRERAWESWELDWPERSEAEPA